MAKVSIIIPVCNAEAYILKCLKSLQDQSFSDIKIICIENGSSDNSWEEILSQKKDKRLVALRAPHQDVSYARNVGLFWALKFSPYVMFCDADDTYERNMVETMVEGIERTAADLACCEICVKYKTDLSLKESDNKYYTLKFDGIQNNIKAIINNIDYSLCNKIFRASIIRKYSLTFPGAMHYEDACFCWKYLSVANSVFFIKKKLYNYLRHENSIMNKTFSKSNDSINHLAITDNVYEFLKLHNLRDELMDEFVKFYDASVYFAKQHSNGEYLQNIEDLDLKLSKKFFPWRYDE
ncbi:MAG: glycosyltransferase family 2 protein [Desulfovibrio sp.]|nr:glycosyltransferase family 2 protein [Desulfovibrio sp.]